MPNCLRANPFIFNVYFQIFQAVNVKFAPRMYYRLVCFIVSIGLKGRTDHTIQITGHNSDKVESENTHLLPYITQSSMTSHRDYLENAIKNQNSFQIMKVLIRLKYARDSFDIIRARPTLVDLFCFSVSIHLSVRLSIRCCGHSNFIQISSKISYMDCLHQTLSEVQMWVFSDEQ